MSKFNKGDYRKETQIDECVVPVIRTNGYGGGYAENVLQSHNVVLRTDHLLALAVNKGDRVLFRNRLSFINHALYTAFDMSIVYDFDELVVEWLPEDERFYVQEYDGYESIITSSKMNLTKLYPVADLSYGIKHFDSGNSTEKITAELLEEVSP